MDALWANEWFEGFDRRTMERRGVQPPHVPQIADITDVSNFDYYDDEYDEFDVPYRGKLDFSDF